MDMTHFVRHIHLLALIESNDKKYCHNSDFILSIS